MKNYLPLALVLLLAPLGCKACEDEDEGTTAEDGDSTSGGERTADGIDAPPGSRDADEGWDGDEPGGGETASGGGAQDGTQGGGSDSNESPWGSPVTEQGRPLPPRRPMNSGARNAYAQGVSAAQRGDSQSAVRAFEQALAADGNAYKAAYNLGVMADRAGNERRALEYYRRALRILPDYERAAQGIVTIHVRNGNVSEAVSFIEPLARQWVRNLYLQAIYAEVLVHANRPDDALTAARQALRRDERFVPAMVAIVKASLKQNRTELAEAIIGQALEVDDENAELHYLKGRMLLEEEGRQRDALNELRRAVSLRPDFAEARMALGIQLMSGANYTEALQQFQAAANLAPTLVAVHLNLGDAHRANKNWQQAKASFDRALSMESNLPEAHFNLALMYMTAGEDFPGQSNLESLQKAVEEFNTYRSMMGPRLPRDDPSEAYLEDLNRQVEREQRRIERDRARAQREAERAARQAEEGGGE
jgi:tetratricopeptide (TPR) repeat protein